MTTLQPRAPNSVTQATVASVGTTFATWLAAIHLVGWLMAEVFAARVGFSPVWFVDCVACVPVGWALPLGWPLLDGMSLVFAVGFGAAMVTMVCRRRGASASTHRLWSMIAAVALAVFGVQAFMFRYPGSLPSVLLAVLPALIGAGAFWTSVSTPSDGDRIGPTAPSPLTVRSRLAVALGIGSMAMLGGVISVAAVGMGALAWEDTTDRRNHRAAALASGLGVLSGILRWALVRRYPWLGILV